jgi:hypothetical protein
MIYLNKWSEQYKSTEFIQELCRRNLQYNKYFHEISQRLTQHHAMNTYGEVEA